MSFNERPWEQIAGTAYDHDPGVTAPSAVAWVDMSGYQAFGAMVVSTRAAVTIDRITIQASASSDGSSPQTIKTWTGSDPASAFDWVALDVTAQEIGAVDESLRYVSVWLGYTATTGEALVFYVRTEARNQDGVLTTESVA